MRKFIIYLLTGLVILAAPGYTVLAQEKVYRGVIPDPGHIPPLVFSASCPGGCPALTIQDPVYADPALRPLIGAVKKMQNVVMLKVNEEAPDFIPSDFVADVTVDITKTPTTGGGPVTISKILHLSYKLGMGQKSDAAAYFVADDGGYILTVQITNIQDNVSWDITKVLQIVSEIHAEYDAPFDFASPITGLINLPVTTTPYDELEINWNYPGSSAGTFNSFPTDYDIEWAWVDELAADNYKTSGVFDQGKIFFNNATRVTVPIGVSSYKIPLLYDGKGFIFYRVRANQQKIDGQVINGNWTTNLSEGAGMFTIAAGHEEGLNWQVSTTYAEEGKRKTVIQYFDGTLRGRQTVTKDNSQPNPTTVVAETFYDFQGRPTIQVLPAPTLNNVISFTRNFNNNNIDGNGYPKELYDILNTGQPICAGGAPPLSKAPGLSGANGAGNYYSAQNPDVNIGFNKFIPEANGYAFTETRYTQDATGRILAQSGVGQAHQLGSGHETKYYYASAAQSELDILFGTDAGKSSHYQKNMVRDANGQFSVSYTDMFGRTVATALAGEAPTSLEALKSLQDLPGYTLATAPKKELLDEETNVVDGRSIVMVKDLLVTSPGMMRFIYKLDPEQLQLIKCAPNSTPICYDCLYDLTIVITNPCDNSIIHSEVKRNFTLPLPANSVCGAVPAKIEVTFDVSFAATGSYVVTKTLTLSKEAQDNFRANAMLPGNLVCKDFATILAEIKSVMLLENTNCQPTCTSCTQKLGTREQFKERFRLSAGLTVPQMADYEVALNAAYDQAAADCAAICESGSDRVNNYRDIMLMDMMPDRGQYARLLSDDQDVNGNTIAQVDLTVRPENIFFNDKYKQPLTPTATPDPLGYKDEYDQPDVTGTLALVGAMSHEQFTDNFKESWAKQLLPYHPEYKKLQLVESDPMKEAYHWQELWQNKTKWSEVAATMSGSTGLPDADPFYANILAGSPLQLQMSSRMYNYIPFGSPTPTFFAGMWQFAIASVKCKDISAPVDQLTCLQNCPNTVGTFPPEIDCDPEKDMVWRIFSAMYFREREVFIYEYLQSAASVDQSIFNAPSNTLYPRYQPRFINPAYAGISVNVPANLADAFNEAISGTGSSTATTAAMQAQFEENCRSYAVNWLEQVQVFNGCTGSDITPGEYDALIEQLVTICRQGSDLNHPLGSSTVPAGNTTYPGTFEQALSIFMTAHSVTISETCHPYIINFPKPYDKSHVIADEEIWETKPETCICDRLQTLRNMHAASGIGGTFLNYLKTVHGTTMDAAGLAQLEALCNPFAPAPSCQYLEVPIILPPVLQCGASNETCVDCNQYNTYRSAFLTQFSSAIPPGMNLPVMYPATEQEERWNKVFTDFMNYKTGFAKQWHEYANFGIGCQLSSEPINAPGGLCSRFNGHIQAFNSLPQNPAATIEECQQSFADYFNQQEATNFSYGQIKYLYNRCLGGSCTDIPINCYGNTLNELIINNNDAYLITLDAAGNAGSCSGTPTSDLTVVAPLVESGTSTVAFLDTVAVLSPAITITALNIQPDTTTNCSNGAYLFQKTFGGNSDDFAYDMAAAADNGYVMAGQTSSYGSGGTDGIITKVSQSGTLMWSKALGGTADDIIYSIKKTSDNGYIACGLTKSFGHPAGDAWLVKLSSSGTVQWSKKYGDGNAYGDVAYDVIQLADGGFAFCGLHRNAAFYAQSYVVRTDNTGNKIWSKSYGIESNSDGAMNLVEDGSNLVVVGYNQGVGSGSSRTADSTSGTNRGAGSFYDSYLMKLNTSNGNVVFTQEYDGDNRSTWFRKIRKTNEGYQVHALVMNDYVGTNMQNYIWNIYSNGTVHNVRKLVIPGTTTKSYGWHPLPDGGFVTANGENNSTSDVIYSKINAAGTLDWSNKLSFEGNQAIYGMVPTSTGGYAAAGNTNARTPAVPACSEPLPTHLCGLNDPINPSLEVEPDDPCDDVDQLAWNAATEAYNLYLTKVKNDFDKAYQNKCLAVQNIESFTVQAPSEKEYHYTLYYYDQSGSLVQTVPPAGVDDFNNSVTARAQFLEDVKTARLNETVMRPAHTLVTKYRYNTLGQVVQQQSPDGGLSKFWYDELGRLVISQNAKQATSTRYSYTLYDELGRITQVGQKQNGDPMDQSVTRDKTALENWLNNTSHPKEQITRTVYDVFYGDETTPGLDSRLLVQINLRNRVSYTQVVDVEPPTPSNPNNWIGAHQNATFYTYDIHGNVDELVHDYNEGVMKVVDGGSNRFKKMAYRYDLVSGKVNTVIYQPDFLDAGDVLRHHDDRFYHRYDYDAENKLTVAETSHDGIIWETDARYYYYKHGPMARTVLGQQQVQGIDYAYTLQGWLKGVNSTAISATPTEDCAPGTARDRLDIYNRQQYGQPQNYVARQEINFLPNFIDNTPDDYVTELNASLGPCIPIIANTPYIAGDMGQDGKNAPGNLNQFVARDAYSFSLNYYTTTISGQTVNDYQSINTAEQPFTNTGMFNIMNTDPAPKQVARPLFNGNIASMFVNIPKLGEAHLYGYQYDQLNRIVSMDAFRGFDPATNSWGVTGLPTATENYKERVSYDPNGNILSYLRNGSTASTPGGGIGGPQTMDDLTYQYPKDANGKFLNNRLRYVQDQVPETYYSEDIDSQTPLTQLQVQNERLPEQTTDNYAYDEIGNLVKDKKEDITNIEWTVYGKIKGIYKSNGLGGDYLAVEYAYDAGGNRIQKIVHPADRGFDKTTIYVRDASGNVMAVYEKESGVNNGDLAQTEAHLYGSSRLGIYRMARNVETRVVITDGLSKFVRGEKMFELSNHLGNVLVAISDRKLQVDTDGNGMIDYYAADVVTAVDYYPFGMDMPGRKFGADNRYGFNGKERDKDMHSLTAYDYGFRIYNPAIGKFLSVDPLTDKYAELTPYQFASDCPISGVDQDGAEFKYYATAWVMQQTLYQGGTIIQLGEENTGRLKLSYETGVYDPSVLSKGVYITDLLTGTSTFTGLVFTFSMSDLGYSATVVNIGGINRVLPSGIDVNDLPGDDDEDFWDNLETEDEYLGRVKAEVGEIFQNLMMAYDMASIMGLPTKLRNKVKNKIKEDVTENLEKAVKKLPKSKIVKAGETAATKFGRHAHDLYKPAGNYITSRKANRLKNGLIPDAVDRKNFIVRELKPNNQRAINRGKSQLKKYVEQLEKEIPGSKGKWKTVVDTYDKGPNGKPKYNFNTPE